MYVFEKEMKAMLSRQVYEAILNGFDVSSGIKTLQINHYYDTEQRDFYNCNETLRVRQVLDKLFLQRKYDKEHSDKMIVSKEFSVCINDLPHIIIVDNKKAKPIGCLITKRITIENEAFTVFLDQNFYLGKVDYELEVEAEDIACVPKDFLALFENKNIALGKYSRFVRQLNTINSTKNQITYNTQNNIIAIG